MIDIRHHPSQLASYYFGYNCEAIERIRFVVVVVVVVVTVDGMVDMIIGRIGMRAWWLLMVDYYF